MMGRKRVAERRPSVPTRRGLPKSGEQDGLLSIRIARTGRSDNRIPPESSRKAGSSMAVVRHEVASGVC